MTQDTPSSGKPAASSTKAGFLLLIGLGILFLINQDQGGPSGMSEADFVNLSSDPADDAAAEAINAVPSARQLARAADHAGRAIGAMGAEGAVFYSERCHEALEASFTPQSLDRCYAFDTLAERLIEEEHAAYFYPRFWPDNARVRWNQAVKKAGVSATEFATRRAALEKDLDAIAVTLIAPPKAGADEKSEVQPADDVQDQRLSGEQEPWGMLSEDETAPPDASAISGEAQPEVLVR